MLFIDNYNHFTFIYFICSKAYVLPTFQTFIACVETQNFMCVKVLHYDCGENTCLMLFNLFSNKKLCSLRVYILTPLNRMVPLSVKIIIF